MKTAIIWLLVGMMAALGCSSGYAQINYSSALAGSTLIYSNAFNGSGAVNITGTQPNYESGILGGSSSANWVDALGGNDTSALYANGVMGTAQGDAWLLPFVPQAGYVYALNASVNFAAYPNNWVGAGFCNYYGAIGGTDDRFNSGGVDFGILTANANANAQAYSGPGTGSPSVQYANVNNILNPATGAHTLTQILDTTGSKWVIACFVDGIQAGQNYTYASNPTILGLGLTQNAGVIPADFTWNSFTLSATPIILGQQPVPAAVSVGTAFTNAVVVAAGSAPFYYQWYTNNVAIGHATNSTLVINPVSTNNAGTNYFVVVTNNYGAVTSTVVSLTVLTNAITNVASQLTSPDGSLVLTFAVTNFDGTLNCPVYGVARNGQTLITASKLGLTFGSGGLLQGNLTALSETTSSNNSTWQPVYAETSSITNNYNQLVVNLQELIPPYRLLQLNFRAYNEGAAFSYTLPSQAGFAGATNLTEQTEFRFATNYVTWATYTAQGVYAQTTLNGVISGCERPLPVQLVTNSLTVALGEAGLVNYSRMKFAPLSGRSNSLVSLLDGPVTNSLPLTSPWRFIMAADSPGQLLDDDYFVLNLNDPCALTNTAWIQPGKTIRSGLTTQSGMACIDFCVKHNLSYIEFDAGWYGPENTTPVATNVVSGLNLPAVISYGASNNVGVILYVNWLAMTNELNLLPPLYQSWGVKGIKYGFVSVGPQQYTAIVNDAARICASNQMMMEVHDEFRPSGYTRTYPNFMSVEGILGDESTPTATQDTTSLFSRLVVGGADHTACYFDARVTNNWTYAYQLAKAVCFYSPWEYLYWYDSPTNASGYVAGAPDMITEVPEMEFWNYMPTVWDETEVLQGSIGQYAIIARRTGTQWFIGAMNANTTRTFNVPLSFLTTGQQYVENVYSQDPTAPTRTHVRIDRLVVDSSATLTMTLGASQGEAIRLLPANPPAIPSVSRLNGGGFGLTITGMVSQPYSLWSSPNLTLPSTNWTLLNSGLITNNLIPWNDVLNQTQRFYRCSTP